MRDVICRSSMLMETWPDAGTDADRTEAARGRFIMVRGEDGEMRIGQFKAKPEAPRPEAGESGLLRCRSPLAKEPLHPTTGRSPMAASLTEEELTRLEALHARRLVNDEALEDFTVAASQSFPDLLASARAVQNVEAAIKRKRDELAQVEWYLSSEAFAAAKAALDDVEAALTAEPTAGEER